MWLQNLVRTERDPLSTTTASGVTGSPQDHSHWHLLKTRSLLAQKLPSCWLWHHYFWQFINSTFFVTALFIIRICISDTFSHIKSASCITAATRVLYRRNCVVHMLPTTNTSFIAKTLTIDHGTAVQLCTTVLGTECPHVISLSEKTNGIFVLSTPWSESSKKGDSCTKSSWSLRSKIWYTCGPGGPLCQKSPSRTHRILYRSQHAWNGV